MEFRRSLLEYSMPSDEEVQAKASFKIKKYLSMWYYVLKTLINSEALELYPKEITDIYREALKDPNENYIAKIQYGMDRLEDKIPVEESKLSQGIKGAAAAIAAFTTLATGFNYFYKQFKSQKLDSSSSKVYTRVKRTILDPSISKILDSIEKNRIKSESDLKRQYIKLLDSVVFKYPGTYNVLINFKY